MVFQEPAKANELNFAIYAGGNEIGKSSTAEKLNTKGAATAHRTSENTDVLRRNS